MKKIGIVSMVKNESDIIELFLKINLRSADRIYLIDHCSDDGTLEIAKEMQRAYPQIELFSYPNKEFNQSQVITSAVRSIASKNILDFIIPLDGDEFLCDNNSVNFKEMVSDSLPDNQAGIIPWETYCPISLDYFSSRSPLYSCFKRRSKEPNQFYKVVLGNEYAKECVVTEGNHSVLSSKYSSEIKVLDFKLKHVPVRSSQQIVRKALMGSYSLALKHGRQLGEGYHWDEIAGIARGNNYKINLEDLTKIAVNYASKSGEDVCIDYDSHGVGLVDDELIFSELAKPSLIRDFDLLTLNLISRIIG